MNLSDEKLMQLYIDNRDDKIFAIIYERHFVSLCKFLSWQLTDREQAKDITQNILLKVYQRPHLFDTRRNFKAWLFSIARNDWKNHLRANTNREKYSRQAADHWQLYASDSSSNDAGIQLKLMQSAIRQLSEAHREVVLLKYSNNLSLREISEVLDCSLGTVKSRLFYALKQLKSLSTQKQTTDGTI